MRIWWQSFVDPAQNAPYIQRLSAYLDEIAGDNALRAEDEGYNAFVFGHFQDPGLYEARSAVRIPVVGMGEASLHWAAQLGRNLALVTIDSVFERWHQEQADLYGLSGRVTHVVSVGAVVEDYAPAFAGNREAYVCLLERFRAVVEPLVCSGADVIVPAGALSALLFAGEHGMTVGHAPVVNCVVVTLTLAEAAVRIRELTGLEPSRGPSFALAPAGAIDDFRTFVRQGRGD